MLGTCKFDFDAKVNVVTTPQNNLNDLRSRYGAPANQGLQIPAPQAAPDGQVYNPAQPPPPPQPAQEQSVEFHPVDDNPFSALSEDDSIQQFERERTPSEWRDAPSSPQVQQHHGPAFQQIAQPHSAPHPAGNSYVPPRQPPPAPPTNHGGGYDGSSGGYSTDNYSGNDGWSRGVKKSKPQMGFRGFLANRVGIPVSKGKHEMERDRYVSLVNRSLLSQKVIGFIGGKGGIGKTTTLMSVASTIAELRSKTVVAVSLDYNQTLTIRTKSQTNPARGDVTLLEFATDPTIESPTDVSSCMRINPHRLSVLGMGLNPISHDLLTPAQYETALAKLKRQYEIIFIDFGNIPNSDAYWAALNSLDALVLVTSTENDSMQGVRLVENMVQSAGRSNLLEHTSVIVNHRSPAEPKVDVDRFVGSLQSKQSREVVDIPWDEHLSESGPIDLDLLNKKRTRWQLLLTSAVIISSLPA